MKRILLLMATRTYKARAFMDAARALGAEVVVGSERRQALAGRAPGGTLALDFRRPDRAARKIAEFAREHPLDAVVGVDDETTVLAAMAAQALGLPHNSVESVRSARDKYRLRTRLAEAGLPSPTFERLPLEADAQAAARRARYPCVLKPVSLSASRGVIRADDPAQFVEAFGRIRRMLTEEPGAAPFIQVESFLPGPEVALEGLLVGGEMRVLALFDKPDPLDGPYFEETIYVTPSRLPVDAHAAVHEAVDRAARALGLRHGPVHAELRLGSDGPYVVEVAPRTIGGLCSNALRFGTDMTLEEVVLRRAVGAPLETLERERRAAGAMMLPIPIGGVLRGVRGIDEAEKVPGVQEVAMTIPVGQPVVPLPEGDRYLGFVFARAETPEEVEQALREAHRRLTFVIVPPDAEPDEELCVQAGPARWPLPMAAAR